jgi:nitric oxide reductase large subunit
MKEHDIYVDSLLDQLNLRFAPPQGKDTHYGGLEEMIALQKEFKIFKRGRSFKTSVGALNIGATNTEAKNRLLDYFGNLAKHESSVARQNGDVAIVNTLIKNLASKKPLPVYFTFHDMRAAKGNTRVLIDEKGRPLPFFKQDYITVSFPTLPHEPEAKAAPKSSKPAKAAKTVKKKS